MEKSCDSKFKSDVTLKALRGDLTVAEIAGKYLEHFFDFSKNSLPLKKANFSSLKRRSNFTLSKNSPGFYRERIA